MLTKSRLPRWVGAVCGGALVMLVAGCLEAPTAPAASAVATAVPPGSARIWFYRDYEPSVSLNLAAVSLNGALAGYAQPDGSAFYRDVAPGRYHITVASFGRDVNQAKDVDLRPGEAAYAKILALSSWESGGDTTSYQRDTFYVSLMPPQIAQRELSTHPLNGG